jgi:uncharacterized protein YeaO (DUF488 family)
MAVEIRRVDDDPGQDPAYRVMVDRLWPRGVRRDSRRLDAWLKKLAPSDALPGSGTTTTPPGGKRSARATARNSSRSQHAASWRGWPGGLARETVLLLSSARDRDHNQAVVLKELIDERLARQEGHPSDPPLQ